MTFTAEQLAANLNDPWWRLSNLYKIIVKGDDDDDGLVLQFRPNRAQRRLLRRLHTRNLILKARQLGFTTLIAILWLDTALFSKSPIRCGMIAQDKEAAANIFRDKVRFAYDRLPESLRLALPLEKATANELVFAHNKASIRVATSMRSGTIHRLHVSEMGKIGAKYPQKAREVVTGSFPAVPQTGVIVVESTAEGREGEFYKLTMRAKSLSDAGRQLGRKDFAFHFFPWFDEPGYVLDPGQVVISEQDREYFEEVEAKIGRPLSDEQRAWYVATRDSDFSGEDEKMWQEYPSTPEEAFQVSTEGCFYSKQLTAARKDRRIVPRIPLVPGPVNTFWDLGHSGSSDATGIWFHQRVGMENRFLRYKEWDLGETISEYVRYLQSTGYTFGRHYLPHDAENKRLGLDANKSIADLLREAMPGQKVEIVDRVDSIHTGIQMVRDAFPSCWFDEEGCADGIAHIGAYRKEWDEQHGVWKPTPRHDHTSHAADSFRQFAQEVSGGNVFREGYGGAGKRRASGSWRTA